jgi:hypothetical protein
VGNVDPTEQATEVLQQLGQKEVTFDDPKTFPSRLCRAGSIPFS